MGYHSLGPIYFGFWKPDLFLSTSLSHMNVHVFVGGGMIILKCVCFQLCKHMCVVCVHAYTCIEIILGVIH